MNMILPWQQKQWHNLHADINKIPHALLLSGHKGLGKQQFAIFFAKALLCQTRVGDQQACGYCRSCHLLAVGNHPDYLFIQPETVNNAIKVDAIRQLVTFSLTTSNLNHNKVILIQPAHHMNIAASNALLKVLEEPPPGVYFILISEQPSHLLPTIRSRCQMIKFHLPDYDQALQYLRDNSINNPELLLALAHGAPLAAIALSNSDGLAQRQHFFQLWCDFMREGKNLLSISKQWQKIDMADGLHYLQSWIMDIIRLRLATDAILINIDFMPVLQAMAKNCDTQHLFICLDKLYDISKILSDNIVLNKSLLIENILLFTRSVQKTADKV